MGKIEDAIKKINVEIQKEPNEEVLAKIGEYIIDQITTEEVAEKILAEDKSLKKIYGEIKEEAYKKALKERNGRNCVGIGCDGEDTINRVLKYFGLTANPQAPAEEAKRAFASVWKISCKEARA